MTFYTCSRQLRINDKPYGICSRAYNHDGICSASIHDRAADYEKTPEDMDDYLNNIHKPEKNA